MFDLGDEERDDGNEAVDVRPVDPVSFERGLYGDTGADQEDPGFGDRGFGAVDEGVEGRAVLGSGEAEQSCAVVAVALQVGVLVGLPGDVAPDEVGAVLLDDGGDGATGQVLALGAAVDDVAPPFRGGSDSRRRLRTWAVKIAGGTSEASGETASRSVS